ncbi:ATP-binding protein [Streptomyces sp. NPDC006235]|uniref:AlbA family DNA-binding domain-containing protein n=1 Tax=Streptomyces sp. NPDC006235 TaxID=3156736 RepID=UPI0033BCA9CF
MSDNSTDLADLLGTQESASLEFKRTAKREGKRGDAIGNAVCAMANDLCGHGGGDVLIGVDDKGQPVDDVDLSDRALLQLTELRDDGRILDRPSLTVDRAVFRGKPVIRLHVEACATPPVRFEGVVWVRPGPTTRRASREDERVLAERRRAKDIPFDTRPLSLARLDDLDLDLFRQSYLPSMVAPEVIEENGRPVDLQLSSLHLLTPDGTPTVLGLLTVGLDPGSHIPGGTSSSSAIRARTSTPPSPTSRNCGRTWSGCRPGSNPSCGAICEPASSRTGSVRRPARTIRWKHCANSA